MSEDFSPKPWFRPKDMGSGWTPITWQGWLVTLALVALMLVTSLLGDPSKGGPDKINRLIQLKATMGLGAVYLPFPAMVGTLFVEIAAFMLFARWKSRPLRPLD